MKRLTFDETRPQSRDVAQQRPALACHADGCSWVASAGYDGRMFCLAHLGVSEPKMWPQITSKTAEFKWFADFIAEIQGAINSQVPNVRWLEIADSFWHEGDYPEFAPTPAERKSPALYLYRLHGEARSLATGRKRPAAHIPQGRLKEFQPRAKLSSEVAA